MCHIFSTKKYVEEILLETSFEKYFESVTTLETAWDKQFLSLPTSQKRKQASHLDSFPSRHNRTLHLPFTENSAYLYSHSRNIAFGAVLSKQLININEVML